MCGLTGVLDLKRSLPADTYVDEVARMAWALRHRGPDDEGVWADPTAGIALGHRRLAILDLSELGHQPMQSVSGRFVLAYNGEIYNFRALRQHLAAEGWCFRGHSDTEVILALFDTAGIGATIDRLNGMFALAVWDRQLRQLHLVRDRLGEKPLYYGWIGSLFVFGSELKALRANSAFAADIDRNVLALYVRYSCIPAPFTVFRDVFKLSPATHLVISAEKGEPNTAERTYWSVRSVAESGTRDLLTGSSGEIVDELEQLLAEAVQLRMEADVPLGAFLSGGVDSSIVTALMQRAGSTAVKTFTIGFEDPAYDESEDAARVARHLGTDHTALRVSAADVLDLIPRLPTLYDEPFGDDSQIPTFLVSQLARRDVTVALSGDGGDELFAGYNRHVWAGGPARHLGRLPLRARRAGAAMLSAIAPATWDALFRGATRVLPKRYRVRTPITKVQKLADVMASETPEAMYLQLVSRWKQPSQIVVGAEEPQNVVTDPSGWPALDDPLNRLLYLDSVGYLPDDILVKVDRAAMAVSLESRIPFLDHRVVEFAWRVPLSMKLRSGEGKWLLRQLLDRYVPRGLVERPKMGFGLPIGSWLRGPLRPWAESLLEPNRLDQDGLFVTSLVRSAWDEHLEGRRDGQYELWSILMFQSWLNDTDDTQDRQPSLHRPADPCINVLPDGGMGA